MTTGDRMKRLAAATLVLALVGLGTPAARAATTTSDAPTRTTRVNGADIAYRVIGGKGTPVVLVTGYAVTMDEWDPAFVDRLAKRHTVVLLDNRGAGRSKGGTDGLTIHTMAEDTYALIKKLKLRKPHVLGWSMGGMVVQDLALSAPSTPGSISLFATATGGPGTPPIAPATIERLAPAHTQDDLWDLNFTSRSAYRAYKKRVNRRKDRSTVAADAQLAQFLATGQFVADSNVATFDALPSLRVKALVANGTLDKVLPAANTPRLAARIRRATQVQYPGLEHAFMFQKPTQVADRLIPFIRSAG